MFTKFRIVMTFMIIGSGYYTQACMQQAIAIPAKDFKAGNSLVIITKDAQGVEQISGCISFDETKTEYSQSDISQYTIALGAIDNQPEAIITDMQYNPNILDDQTVIYLYFNVDTQLDIIRVLVIKNNLLVDNPFDVIRFNASQLFTEELDENDWGDDFSQTDLPVVSHDTFVETQPISLSYYDTMVLASCIAWIYGQAQIKQAYHSVLHWFKSKYAE